MDVNVMMMIFSQYMRKENLFFITVLNVHTMWKLNSMPNIYNTFGNRFGDETTNLDGSRIVKNALNFNETMFGDNILQRGMNMPRINSKFRVNKNQIGLIYSLGICE